DHRLDPTLEQSIHEPIVEIEPHGVHGALTLGEDSTPRNAEAIRLHTQPPHQSHVLAIAVVVIAGDIAGVAARARARRVREAMPNTRTCAIRERRALDLIGGGGRAKPEISGKFVYVSHAAPHSLCWVQEVRARSRSIERAHR